MKKKVFSLALTAVLCLSLLSACAKPGANGSAPEKHADLAAFAQTLLENHEFSAFVNRLDPTDEELGAVMLDNYMPGLRELELEQVEVYMSMVSFNTGEFSLVQAKNAEDAAKVQEIFQSRIDSMTEEGMNYPETVEQWTNSAQVAANGNYVLLVCHEDAAAIVDEFNALFA